MYILQKCSGVVQVKGIIRFLKELLRFNFVDRRVKLGRNVRIDHFTVIEHDVEIGDNAWIGSWTHIRTGTKIGCNSEVRDQCYVAGFGVVIGNNTKILQQCNISQGTKIGDKCFIAVGVTTSNVRRMKHERDYQSVTMAPIIGRGVRMGNGANILGSIFIADESFIGAGAVVTKDTEPFGVYVGNPARKLREVSEEERIRW